MREEFLPCCARHFNINAVNLGLVKQTAVEQLGILRGVVDVAVCSRRTRTEAAAAVLLDLNAADIELIFGAAAHLRRGDDAVAELLGRIPVEYDVAGAVCQGYRIVLGPFLCQCNGNGILLGLGEGFAGAVCRGCEQRRAVQRNDRCSQTAVAAGSECAAGKGHRGISLDSVLTGFNRNITAEDLKRALCCLDAVALRIDVDCTGFDCQGSSSADRVAVFCFDIQRAAVQLEVIVAVETVCDACCDFQRAFALHSQVIFCMEHCKFRFYLSGRGFLSVGEDILLAGFEIHRGILGIFHHDARCAAVFHIDAVEEQLDSFCIDRFVGNIDENLSAVQRSVDVIRAGMRDCRSLAGDIDIAAFRSNAAALEVDVDRIGIRLFGRFHASEHREVSGVHRPVLIEVGGLPV